METKLTRLQLHIAKKIMVKYVKDNDLDKDELRFVHDIIYTIDSESSKQKDADQVRAGAEYLKLVKSKK